MHSEQIVTDKERKTLDILNILKRRGTVSKTDLSRETGYNIVTVSNYVNNFIEKQLVLEKGLDVSTGGRRPTLIELNADAGYIIGVGLTVMHMVAVLIDYKSKIRLRLEEDRGAINSELTVKHMLSLVDKLLKDTNVARNKIVGIGIGIPGVIDTRGQTVRWPSSLGDEDKLVNVSFKNIFEDKFKIPTFVENDANAAVFGEQSLGVESDVKNMIYMYSGIGCGIIINRQIYRGSNNCAGELGIINLESGQTEKERYIEAEGLGRWEIELGMVRRIKNLLQEDTTLKSKIYDLAKGNIEQISSKTIFDAVRENDELAVRVVEESGKKLGKKVAFLVNLLNPEMIVIGGGIEQAGPTFLNVVRNTVKEWAVDEATNGLTIIPSQLAENSVALGAACLVMRELFKKM